MSKYNGLENRHGNFFRLSDAKTRSFSPVNFSGEPGQGGMALEGTGASAARDLGRGWKISSSINISAGEERVLADIPGPGVVQHIWMTVTRVWRHSILRIYWDDSETPAVECKVGDFFACGWNCYAQLSYLTVCVNPDSAFNSYWQMLFSKRCKITLTKNADAEILLYYLITYALAPVPEDSAYFHAQFHRANPLPYAQMYTILNGVKGQGQYVGTYMVWDSLNTWWWGEGEIKLYIDDDCEIPTICGAGTEDYFCGSYNFDASLPNSPKGKKFLGYNEFTTPYSGLPQVIRQDGRYQSQLRFGMYGWHIVDPILFQTELKVTIQALGWCSDIRYLPLQDDIASVSFWYRTLPTVSFPVLPGIDELEII